MKNLNIKKWVALTVCALMTGFATQVSAINLTLDDAYYLGSIKPGHPPGSNEDDWMNILIGLSVGGATNASSGTQTITRSTNDFGVLPELDSVTKRDDNGANPTWTIGADSLYLLGKYGNSIPGGQASFVWYIGDLPIGSEVTLPTAGLSHSTIGSGERTVRVPDGGSTLALIGLAVTGLGLMRRKLA